MCKPRVCNRMTIASGLGTVSRGMLTTLYPLLMNQLRQTSRSNCKKLNGPDWWHICLTKRLYSDLKTNRNVCQNGNNGKKHFIPQSVAFVDIPLSSLFTNSLAVQSWIMNLASILYIYSLNMRITFDIFEILVKSQVDILFNLFIVCTSEKSLFHSGEMSALTSIHTKAVKNYSLGQSVLFQMTFSENFKHQHT